ncbi:MAG TPA: hypothetical protein VFU81_22475 [Thermomicrobiales bacterium]|nr:hypothetical protein [Thermomicrobiales bacterium]
MDEKRGNAGVQMTDRRVGRRQTLRALIATGLGLAVAGAGGGRTGGWLTGPPPVAAAEQLTGVCYAPTNAVATRPSDGRLAETFVASASGKLSRVQLDLYKPANSSGDYLVQLLAVNAKGTPTNHVLAKAKIYDSDVPVGMSATVNAHFRPGKTVTLKAGKRYAVAVSRPGPDGILANSAINGCVADRLFRSDTQTDPFVEIPDIDLRVAVFVGF